MEQLQRRHAEHPFGERRDAPPVNPVRETVFCFSLCGPKLLERQTFRFSFQSGPRQSDAAGVGLGVGGGVGVGVGASRRRVPVGDARRDRHQQNR